SGKYYLPYNISYTKEIVLSYRESVFSFEFAAMHYSNQRKNQYAYKMEGFEENWNYSGNRRFATYTNLEPGEYTFLVKGSNNDGLWTKDRSDMANIKVIITPPFWRTWWFYMLSSMVTVISLLLFINYREKRLRREKGILLENQVLSKKINEHQKELINTIVNNQEADRKRIAGELHDGLGSLLSTIKYNLDAAKDNTEQNQREYHYKTSTELLDQACTDLRNISHEMIPGSLLKLGLVPAIDDFLEKLSRSTQLKIHFNTYKIEERFDESVEIALFRIIQESVNNIYKHAEATEVNIEMMKHEDVLNVIIEDNGKGFNKDQLNEDAGIGLKNMETRVSYINGKFEIDSTPGHGTNIIVEIPI
ncbi:hypothetical protein JYU23_01385, partial [bacterium AH-315-C07]|nr:hypothetical protein [bacterium AH-315-C07]